MITVKNFAVAIEWISNLQGSINDNNNNKNNNKDSPDGRRKIMFRTQFGTVLMLCPWIGNSSSSSHKRIWRCTGIIIICMVSIGRCIIHCTWHTILIVTSSRMDVTLSSFHPVIPTNTVLLYRTTTVFHRSDTTTSTLHLLLSAPYCTCREGGSSWDENGNGIVHVVKQQHHHHRKISTTPPHRCNTIDLINPAFTNTNCF